ncbi:hypothetical protein TSTA_033360 [Talaromyces stipitatus ATCC 10500]|uniref:Uncharacterized protein n=1 Tax=Talaromyces stipitatus (strain ATCC 10500 / CBS 375.48 / QM 6759 / NRRL 1006) TaxID=441959 RepID=B8M5W3_TALSN|nr:uncharacterized protein TSTA_033360 [Talaromyces stipitatus ATCC 10500]EED20090.1 hypothetical protein TSTA_033360 [Talaromyces stipitatus ATCC 10500]
MADPCLFHATLFSAAASIDILMGRKATAVTLYHQTSTIGMLSERLNQEFPLLTYGTLGSVLPLIFYNMLLSTPKPLIDEMGPLIGVIKMYVLPSYITLSQSAAYRGYRTMLSYSCVFDTPPVWDCLHAEFGRSNSILRSLVSSSTFCIGGLLFEKETIESVLDVYEAFSKLDQLSNASAATITTQLVQAITPTNDNLSYSEESKDLSMDNASRMNACCRLSCLIFWELLQCRSQTMTNILIINERAKLLKESMAKISYSFWIRKAPEAFTWITFTGAAGCIDANDRGTFIHRASTILTAVDNENLTLMTQGWKYFCLLRRISGLCRSSADSIYGVD